MKHLFLILYFFSVISINGQVDIQLNLNTFQVNKLSDFIENTEDQFNLTLSNNGTFDEEVKLGFRIQKISGVYPMFEIRSSVEESMQCTNLSAGAIELFTGFDVAPLFDESTIMYEGITQSELINNPELSEGVYEICVEIKECGFLSRDTPPSCQTFTVFTGDPPTMVSICDEEVPLDGSVMMVSWFFQPPFDFMGMMEYEVRILEVIGEMPDFDLFTANEGMFYFSERTNDQFLYIDQSEVMFEAGKTYAIQVQAIDETESFIIKEEGKSIVCTFKMTGENEFSIEDAEGIVQHFPKEGDRIPFRFFPVVGKFGPYSDEYRSHYVYESTIIEEGSGAIHELKEDLKNRWGSGPMKAQNSALTKCEGSPIISNEERSQYISYLRFNDFLREEPGHASFKRGVNHSWDLHAKIYEDLLGIRTAISTNNVIRRSFSVGMNKSILQSPADDAVISQKNISLKFETAKAPQQLGPDYYIYRSNNIEKECDEYNSFIYEGYHLEVAKDSTFSDVVFEKNEIIGAPFGAENDDEYIALKDLYEPVGSSQDLLYSTSNAQAIKEKLYKEVTFDMETPKDTGTYYWRVVWLDDPANKDSSFYETSEIWRFKVEKSQEEEDKDEVAEACLKVCEDCVKPSGNNGILSADSTYQWRGFSFTPSQVSGGQGNYNGKGKLKLPFMFNGVNILIEYQDVALNESGEITKGTAKAVQKEESGSFLNQYASQLYDNSTANKGLNFAGITENQLKGYVNTLEDVVNLPNSNGEWDLPIGLNIDRESIQAKFGIFDLAIDTGFLVNMTILALVDLPQHSDVTMVFGHKICITPEGPGERGELFLWNEIEMTPEGGYELRLQGAQNATDTEFDKVTSIVYNCDGLKYINLEADLEFPREDLLPVGEDFKVIEDEAEIVKAHFGTLIDFYEDSTDFIVDLDFNHPFCISSNKDLVFEANNIVWDRSSIKNPTNFTIPEGHSKFGDETFANAPEIWEGVFAERVGIYINFDFIDGEEFVQSSINNFLYDDGVSLIGKIENILPWEDGKSIEEFGISIDEVNLEIVQNDFRTFEIKGNIGSKYFKEDSHLVYTGGYETVEEEIEGTDVKKEESYFYLNVDPNERDIEIPAMMYAKAGFTKDSHFHYQRKDGENHFDVALAAYLTFDGTSYAKMQAAANAAAGSYIPQLNADSILMEWTYETGVGDNFDFTLSSPQKYLDGFPVSFDGISFEDGSFKIATSVVMSESLGLKGKSNIVVNSESVTEKREMIKFKDISVDDFDVDFEWADIKISGFLEFYDENGSKGIRGDSLGKSLPIIGDKVNMDMDVGIYGFENRGSASFGSSEYYTYWKLGGSYTFSDPKPSIGSINFHSVGGAVFYNMKKEESDDQGNYVFTADHGSLGIALTSQMATAKESTFNMDAGITFTFNGDFGFDKILFEGDCYVMASIEERQKKKENAKVWGDFILDFDYTDMQLSGDIDVYAKMDAKIGELKGGINSQNLMANAEFLVSSNNFYFYMGKPDERAQLDLEIKKINATASLNSYIMVGTGIPSQLPDPHPEIMNLLGKVNNKGDGNSMEGGITTVSSTRQNEQQLIDAKGLAFGASFETKMEAEFFILYAHFNAYLGFDLNISKADEPIFCSNLGEERGVNGWYAEGQLYAGIKGDAGVKISLWGYDKKISFLEFGAALQIQGGVPSPSYFAGMARFYYSVLGGVVSGSSSFAFTLGTPCIVGDGNPLNAMQFITDISSKGEDVSPNSDVLVSFLFPPGNTFPLIEFDEDGNPSGIDYYSIFIESVTLKSTSGHNIGLDNKPYSANKYVRKYLKKDPLSEHTSYSTKVVVGAYRLEGYDPSSQGTSYQRIVVRNKNGTAWREEKSQNFKTGDLPTEILFHNVASSYPLKNQQYFLKNTLTDKKGVITFKDETFGDNYFYQKDNYASYDYHINIINTNTKDSLTTMISNTASRTVMGRVLNETVLDESINLLRGGSRLSFDVGELENETKYKIEFIRKVNQRNFNASINNSSLLAGNRLAISRENAILQQFSSTQKLGNESINFDYIAKAEKQKLSSQILEEIPDEIVFCQWYFKTSRYDRIDQKLNHGKFDITSGGRGSLNMSARRELKERFDHYEVVGDRVTYFEPISPLLAFEIEPKNVQVGWLRMGQDPFLKYRAIPNYYTINNKIAFYNKSHRYKYYAGIVGIKTTTKYYSLGIKYGIKSDFIDILPRTGTTNGHQYLGSNAYGITSGYTPLTEMQPQSISSASIPTNSYNFTTTSTVTTQLTNYLSVSYRLPIFYLSKATTMRSMFSNHMTKTWKFPDGTYAYSIEGKRNPTLSYLIEKKDRSFFENFVIKALEAHSYWNWTIPSGHYTFKINYIKPGQSYHSETDFVLGEIIVPLPRID